MYPPLIQKGLPYQRCDGVISTIPTADFYLSDDTFMYDPIANHHALWTLDPKTQRTTSEPQLSPATPPVVFTAPRAVSGLMAGDTRGTHTSSLVP